jgi:fatty-acyl-CoA synthase
MLPVTLSDWLDGLSNTYTDGTALVAGSGSVSFSALGDRSLAIARGLSQRGIGRGDVVAIWLLNEPDWLAIFFACARLGAVAIAVNTRFRATELADIFERAQPKTIFYRPQYRAIDFAELIDRAGKATGKRPDLKVTLGESGPDGSVSLIEIMTGSGSFPIDNIEAETGAIMFTTSGTTSAPKFVLHPHRSIVAHAVDVAADFGMSAPDAVMLQALPYCGVFGFCQAMAALAAGRPSIVMETFDPSIAAGLVASHSVSHFNATDEMLTALVGAAQPEALSTLSLVGAASFNRGPEALAALADLHGLPIVGLYGMSEVQALFARRHLRDPAEHRFRAGGQPVSSTAALRVRNPETGEALPAGESGELELRGPSQLSGYFADEQSTQKTITSDGFVRTGDLGFMSQDGSFTFESRIGDALRLGGFLVNPDEIAGFIEDVDGIQECVVVGVSQGGRLRAAAFVKTVDNQIVDPEDMLRACREGLAPFKVPVLLHVMDEFPVADGPNGVKIQRGVLREVARELIEK